MRGRTSWPLRNRSVYAGKKCLVATAAARRSDFHQEFVDSVARSPSAIYKSILVGRPTDRPTDRDRRPTGLRRRGEEESSEGRWLTLCTHARRVPFPSRHLRRHSHLEALNM